jgi:hypothetical protein
MADYTGYLVDDPIEAEYTRGHVFGTIDHPWKEFYGWEITTDKSYAGTHSLRILVGGVYTIDCVCEAGSRTVTAKAWAPINGSITMRIIDPDTGALMGTDTTASDEEWEDLSISFTAEKKIYLIFVRNNPQAPMVEGEDPYAYLDDIVVA